MEHALVSIVMEKLGKPLVSMAMKKLEKEVKLIVGAKVELTKLSSTFKSIQAVLNDAERKQITDESVRDWLEKLKDVAYDMEDVLDELILSAEETEPGTDVGNHPRFGNQVWACLFSLFSCCGLEELIRLAHESWTNGDQTDGGGIRGSALDFVPTFLSKVESQRDLAHQIKEIKERLDQIADEKNKYSFWENSSRGDSEREKAVSQKSSLVDESQIHGRDKDRDTIISKLISGSSCQEGRIHVISIVGVGGLGKTTLAQLICNDERVTSHFGKQVLWVCVSDDFNVINLTKAIIEAAGGTSPPHSQLDSLQKQLMETLQDKLFLLVLDDVWNDDSDMWERLWLSFQRGAPGSKILVTTRSEKVAITCRDSAYMHKLEGLSYDDCWLLFRSRAFAGRKAEDCLALEKIGREIVKKCKGVPLSAKVMGSAMHSKTSTQDWQNILESRTWEIPYIANGIFPALLLSYYNLPLHLKPCFAYCSIFPKDHEMEKDKLVKLWLAQGFIKPQGRREMESIGGEYFDELLRRSLLQDAYVNFEGATKCKMHDLLHDLIQFITRNEWCIFENGKTDSSSVTVRHSSFIATWQTSHIPPPLFHAKKLRTLLQIGRSSISTIPDNLFQCARSLRALDFSVTRRRVFLFLLSGRGIKKLPTSIGLLKHLRYLDLSHSMIVELPESVSSLRNLQTLKLNECRCLKRLPSGMSAMVCLRHLEINGTQKLKYLPEGLGRISSLRTLSKFIVGGDGGCKIGELKRLDSLQGKLIIYHLERVGSVDEAKEAQLENKLHIRMLTLRMSGNGEVERMENVVEALRPSLANLEELEIRDYIGSKFPTWIGDSSFSNLVNLKLLNCKNCTQLPGLGRLPSLEYLKISAGLVKRVGSEFYGNGCGGRINRVAFPKLKHLEFGLMYELEEWELRLEDRKIMPSLQSLEISDCRKLKTLLSHLPKSLTSLHTDEMTSPPYGWKQLESLETLNIRNCSELKSLPDDLGQLKSLRSLVIFHCPELLSLPQGLRGLTRLEITRSPLLADRCRGEDWSNISHILKIKIDGEEIERGAQDENDDK